MNYYKYSGYTYGSRDFIHRDIQNELIKKGAEFYCYGGYIFFANGAIKKKVTELTVENPTGNPFRTRVNGQQREIMVLADSIDAYLLKAAKKELSLKEIVNQEDSRYWDTDASWIASAEYGEQLLEAISAARIKEMSVVAKYIKGTLACPSEFNTTPDFEKYIIKFSKWCEDAATAPERIASEKAKESLQKRAGLIGKLETIIDKV